MLNGRVKPDLRATEHFPAPAGAVVEPIVLYGRLSVAELREGVLDGSGRAYREWQRRGFGPVLVDRAPSWL